MNDSSLLAPQAEMDALREQLRQARAEAAALRAELALQRQAGASPRASDLLEANQNLVLATLHAQEGADTARSDLDALTDASQHDNLTGTPNRALMKDRMVSAITLARRRGTRLAVLFVDIDNFKHFNDTRGHAAGDMVLKRVAACLGAAVRDSDTVSRHGGDEFLVLLSEVAGAAEAALVAKKMLAGLARSVTAPDATLPLGVSVGIALFPEDGADAATLINHADAAMYHAKQRGGSGFVFHTRTSTT